MIEYNFNNICIYCGLDYVIGSGCSHVSDLYNSDPKLCPVCLSKCYTYKNIYDRMTILCINSQCPGYFVRLNNKQTILRISHNNRLFYEANIENGNILKIKSPMKFRYVVSLNTEEHIYKVFYKIMRDNGFDILAEDNKIRFIRY